MESCGEETNSRGSYLMTYQGKVRGGVIVLEPGVHLPENSDVIVEPVPEGRTTAGSPHYTGTMRNGVPIFQAATSGPAPGLDLVNSLRDELP
jgi:hypothetical protein